MSYLVDIKSIEHLTHDALRIIAEKPKGLKYTIGQAMDISINKPGWENKLRTFTLTSLPQEEYIEFVIKPRPHKDGVINQLVTTKDDIQLIIHEPVGGLHYKGEGVFIAGGVGIAPFIPIFKSLEKQNKIGNNRLIFANKTKDDIILESQFEALLGDNFINILSEEKIEGYEYGFVTAEFIKEHSQKDLKYYYLCGPKPMIDIVEKYLSSLGVKDEYIIEEKF